MKKAYWITGAALLVAAVGGYELTARGGAPTTTYRATKVETGELEQKIVATGTVQSQNRLEVKPPTAGRIEELKIEEGAPVRKGQILAWMSSAERVSLLDAARARGAAEVARWKDLYRATPILSPLTGMLILSNVKPGQTVVSTDVVFVVSDRLIIQATVDETDIAQVRKEQSARITLDAYGRERIDAHVSRIAFDAKTTNNVTTYTVDVVPESVPDFMKSGMTANVTFLVAKKTDVALVPGEAVQGEGDDAYLFVPDPKKPGAAVRRPVSLGLSDGKQIEIASGVTGGETILLPNWDGPRTTAKAVNPFMPAFGKREKANAPRH